MVCGSYLRNAIIPAGHIANLARRRVLSAVCQRVLCSNLNLTYESNPKVGKFSASTKMMGETGAPEKRDAAVVILPEKVDDGGFVSGGCKSEDGKLSCGYSSFRGKRANMEDFYDIKMSIAEGKKVCMFGIFDGHGGSRAAEYLKGNLFENLRKHPQFMTDTKLAISETYKKTDMDFLDSEKDTYRDDGSTASTAVLVGSRLYVANVGDSRTVTLKSGRAIPLSEDHKPNRTDERKRIESAGGVVMWAGTWRVGGVLAMSRAFGNRMLKQYVVAEPDIQEVEMNQEFELLVLASDGLWDVVPNEDAVSIARTEEEPVVAARKLTETAFSRGSADNITCIVVRFHHPKSDAEVQNAVEGHLTENKTGQAVTSHSAKEDVDGGGQKVEQSGENSRDEKGGAGGQKVNQAGSCGKSHEEKKGVNDQQLHEVGQKGENKDHPTDHNASQAGQSCKAGSVDGQHSDKAGPTMAR